MEKNHSILAPLVVFGPPIRVGMNKSTITPPTAAPDSALPLPEYPSPREKEFFAGVSQLLCCR